MTDIKRRRLEYELSLLMAQYNIDEPLDQFTTEELEETIHDYKLRQGIRKGLIALAYMSKIIGESL